MDKNVESVLERAYRKLEESQRQREEYEKARQIELFWKTWIEACRPPCDLHRQIIGVASKRYNFIFSTPDISAEFIHDVMERCFTNWDKYDKSKKFSTWVLWQTRSIALEIIRSGQKIPVSGPIGIGLKWPYSWVIESSFTDIVPEDCDEEPEFECEQVDEHILEIREWIREEAENDTTGITNRIVDAILLEVPSQPWSNIPTEQTISTRSGIDVTKVKKRLSELRNRYLARFGNI